MQEKDLSGEASSLGELGILYDEMDRLEQSVTFSRQAAEIYVRQNNLVREGLVRNNLANVLIKLQCYDEAWRELQRAIECKQSFGHAALPWTTWAILSELEREVGNQQAATAARQQAINSYLAYRRAGGENQNPGARYCARVMQAIKQGNISEVGQDISAKVNADNAPSWLKALGPKLLAVLHGDRTSSLAADPNLDCDDAVELQLLLEQLGE